MLTNTEKIEILQKRIDIISKDIELTNKSIEFYRSENLDEKIQVFTTILADQQSILDYFNMELNALL